MSIKKHFPKEKDLFPPLKKSFKADGFAVYAEVPNLQRGVDFVAVKEGEHVAVEMKLSFNKEVVHQASGNHMSFHKTYVAYPVLEPVLFHQDDTFWNLRESIRERVAFCIYRGIGILQVLPSGLIFEALESKTIKPWREFDFSQYEESEDDEAGLPCQKGVSEGYMELKAIKAYVIENPDANWKEIFENVQNHYSSPSSLSGSMSQWRGFSLQEFKKSIKDPENVIETKRILGL